MLQRLPRWLRYPCSAGPNPLLKSPYIDTDSGRTHKAVMMVSLAALLLSIAAPLPALAIVESTKETFSGTADGDVLLLRSDEGPSCHGRLSSGLLACSDGRAGRFSYRRALLGGVASGHLAGEDLTIVIG